MAYSRLYALDPQLDINKILLEAQHRWLRTVEICEILQNHEKFRIAQEPQNIPPSGSLFLFDRKAVRYFRKDGHSWRKKKDGKTVKEAHERLKAGSVDVLHCYYAHGEDDEKFQRRSYWLLEEGLSHVVLVHYLEVQGNRTCNRTRATNSAPNNSRKNGDNRTRDTNSALNNSRKNGDMSKSDMHGSVASRFQQHDHLGASQVTDTSRRNSSPTSEYEDAESAYRHQASPEFRSFQEMHSPTVQHTDAGSSSHCPVSTSNNYQGQEEKSNIPPGTGLTYELHRGLNLVPGKVDQSFKTGMFRKQQELETRSVGLEKWQDSGSDSLQVLEWPSIDQKSSGNSNLEQNTYNSSLAQPLSNDGAKEVELCDSLSLQFQTLNTAETSSKPESTGNLNVEDKSNYPSLRQPLTDGVMGKLDSFGRWMSKELSDVVESTLKPASGEYWETNQMALDDYILSPSLSQDQLFSISDFSPNWAFSGSEIKVLISGRFLRNQEEVENRKWGCMFGEVEVPAQIVGDGILQCHTPSHETGRVPFYITCWNRLACSELREFEFQESSVQDADLSDFRTFNPDETLLHMRFEKMLSLTNQTSTQSSSAETTQLCFKIRALLEDDTEQDEFFSADEVKGQLQQKKLLKEKLKAWLIQKASEGENGPCVLDENGQGILHFAAALGYDWCILPSLAAGVAMDFRDGNGWTPLHWAAYCGRERTVGLLISHGADPGLPTDPTTVYTSGRTSSDLASGNSHKGIGGYIAECSLSSKLSSLDLNDSNSHPHDNREKAVKTVSDGGDLTLNASLAAVCNATQAAARIHQVFRYQSFQRKQVEEYGGSEFGISDERALSLIAGKTRKGGRRDDDPVHAAATCIQNKYRSRKGRQQFLLMRKHVIKIQAHVRGHQVRKKYKNKNIFCSVWFIRKTVLRWRGKGRGVSGLKPEIHDAGSNMTDKEGEYEHLKDGRKQTEERLKKELGRVKSMAKYTDAQGQYHRLLNVVSEMQETKGMCDAVMKSLEADFDDDMIDIESYADSILVF